MTFSTTFSLNHVLIQKKKKKTGRKEETASERLRVEQNLCQYFRLECVNIGILNSPRGGDTDTY